MTSGIKNWMVDMKADPFDLDTVVMPLVRIMKDAHISWAQRQEVAWAIQESIREHKSLMAENARVSGENSGSIKVG